MLCPICKRRLDQAILSGVEVDFCPKCLGSWFEEDELRLAKDYKDRSLRWLDIDLWKEPKKLRISPGKKLCPSCRLPLYETTYRDSDIRVDVCNLCSGIWLDRGEFKKIIQYLKKKVDNEVLNHYLKNLVEETWEIFLGPETLREEIGDFLAILKVLNYKFALQHPKITQIISSLPK
jgi:Zn-finger nucleic acid-binding protein